MTLPESILRRRRGHDSWPASIFLEILDEAADAGFACIGGQFQFHDGNGIADMYWLDVSITPRDADEPWDAFVLRATREIRRGFEALWRGTDWRAEAIGWKRSEYASRALAGEDARGMLVFEAFFEDGNVKMPRNP